jgi:hypothetical protein
MHLLLLASDSSKYARLLCRFNRCDENGVLQGDYNPVRGVEDILNFPGIETIFQLGWPPASDGNSTKGE